MKDWQLNILERLYRSSDLCKTEKGLSEWLDPRDRSTDFVRLVAFFSDPLTTVQDVREIEEMTTGEDLASELPLLALMYTKDKEIASLKQHLLEAREFCEEASKQNAILEDVAKLMTAITTAVLAAAAVFVFIL